MKVTWWKIQTTGNDAPAVTGQEERASAKVSAHPTCCEILLSEILSGYELGMTLESSHKRELWKHVVYSVTLKLDTEVPSSLLTVKPHICLAGCACLQLTVQQINI